MKKNSYEKTYAIFFHLYEVLEESKLTYDVKSTVLAPEGWEQGSTDRSLKGFVG